MCLFWLFLCYSVSLLVTPGAQARSPRFLSRTEFKCTNFLSSCGQRALSEQLTSALLRQPETRRRDPTHSSEENPASDLGLRTIKPGNERPGRCVFIALWDKCSVKCLTTSQKQSANVYECINLKDHSPTVVIRPTFRASINSPAVSQN